MTSSARDALEDCRGAVANLVDGVQGREWRRRWILAIVLLRAVGHVLDKVDGPRSPAYRTAIDAWWSNLKTSKPDPAIFWQLIEEERNSILKEYLTTAGQGATVQLASNRQSEGQGANPTVHHYTFNSGAFQGRDQRDVLGEAIAWWEEQLDSIDRAVSTP